MSVLHCNRTGERIQMNVRENRRGNQERTIQRLSTQDTRQTKLKSTTQHRKLIKKMNNMDPTKPGGKPGGREGYAIPAS